MNFIKAWQSLPDYGVSLFVVRFHGEKKDELLGVAANKIMRMSLNAGDHIKTWRFSTMKVYKTIKIYTLLIKLILKQIFFCHYFSGMEHQLGDQTHDDSIWRWQKCHFQLFVSWLQSGPWIYWWLYFPLNEEQRCQPIIERRNVSQIDRWMGLNLKINNKSNNKTLQLIYKLLSAVCWQFAKNEHFKNIPSF